MWAALGSVWNAIISIMMGVEKFGHAFTNIAEVAENASADFKETESLRAEAKRKEIEKELKQLRQLD